MIIKIQDLVYYKVFYNKMSVLKKVFPCINNNNKKNVDINFIFLLILNIM